MNIQAMMKQAQKMQKDMLSAKDEIDKMIFEGKSSFVSVQVILIMYPQTIKNLIECFKKLSGIGEKTAERLSLSVLNLDDEVVKVFEQSLKDIKTKIHHCKICNNLSEDELCTICSDSLRDKKTICVVENIKNIIAIEKTKYQKLLMEFQLEPIWNI